MAHPPRIKPRIGHPERIMEQRGNRRVLAGICEFYLSYFSKVQLNGSLFPETSAHFNRLFETSSSSRATA